MKSKQLLAVLLSSSLFFSGVCLNVSANDSEDTIATLEAMNENLKETDVNKEFKHKLDELTESFKEETAAYICAMNYLFDEESEFTGAETVDEVNKFANFYITNLSKKIENGDRNPILERNVKYVNEILSTRSKECEKLLKDAEELVQSAKDADEAKLAELQEQIREQSQTLSTLQSQTIRILNQISTRTTPKYNDNSNSSEETFKIRRSDYHLSATRAEHHFFGKKRKVITKHAYESIPLFSGEPRIEDIKQKITGDCYFLSALGAIVYSHPEIIKNSIKDNQDGTVTVRFYDNRSEHLKPCYYTIDKRIPDNLSSSENTWAALMEKAYILHTEHISEIEPLSHISAGHRSYFHDYKTIDGGLDSEAMAHITGSNNYGDVDIEISRDNISDEVGDYTEEVEKLISKFENTLKENVCCVSNHASKNGNAINLYNKHAYAVLGIKRVKTRTHKNLALIKLRNPWGKTIPGYEKLEDGHYELAKSEEEKNGMFLLDFNDFLKHFNYICGCKLPQK